MNRADKMLAVLQDGRSHSRHDIWRDAGEFFLTNNAASELRLRGLNVAYDKADDTYQLLSSLDDATGSQDDLSLEVRPHALAVPSVPVASSSEDEPRGDGVLVLFQARIPIDQPPLFAA